MALTAAVGFMIGLGSQSIDQVVEFGGGHREMKLAAVGADRENRSLTVVVEEGQGAQGRCGVSVDGNVAARLGCGQLLATQIVD
ncbi:hypothetical protein [Mycobacterium avium]|uniref:hypothetical protein n=1 Tax=Mycobacterium avium TaxID=1764 RepID=UPI001586DF31|nr:hypothetical protein [Mycobacterium avium]